MPVNMTTNSNENLKSVPNSNSQEFRHKIPPIPLSPMTQSPGGGLVFPTSPALNDHRRHHSLGKRRPSNEPDPLSPGIMGGEISSIALPSLVLRNNRPQAFRSNSLPMLYTSGITSQPPSHSRRGSCSGISPPLSPDLMSNSPMAPCGSSYSPAASVAAHQASEQASETERRRISFSEAKEKSITNCDELRVVLKRERMHSTRLACDLAALKSAALASQAEAEIVEEGRINCLMRRLENLQREKGRIVVELEREEEMLTNTLQKKLNDVRREKQLLEQQIEREQNTNGELLQSMKIANPELNKDPSLDSSVLMSQLGRPEQYKSAKSTECWGTGKLRSGLTSNMESLQESDTEEDS